MTRSELASVRAFSWWIGAALLSVGAGFGLGWPFGLIAAGISIMAYAKLNDGTGR